MAVQKVPQYSDLTIQFTNIGNNISPPLLDLTTVTDYILVIADGHPSNVAAVLLKNSTNGANFTIDNANKNVAVTVSSAMIGTKPGRYYVNLWLDVSGKYASHLPVYFDLEPACNFNTN